MTTDITTTRAELRKRVGRLLGDVVELTATGAGSTTSMVDAIRLSSALESPVNRDIVFFDSTNIGLVRRVLTWNSATGTITFAAVSATVASGHTAQLFNRQAKGWTVAEYNDAINAAIDATWPVYKEPYSEAIGAAFDMTNPVITVPVNFATVNTLQYLDSSGVWMTIPSGYWTQQEALTEITVSGDTYLNLIDGQTVRLIGATRPTPLTSDTSTTGIRSDFIVYQAAAILCQNRYSRGETEFYNPMLLNQQFADKFKPRSRNEGVSVRRI